DALLPRRAEVGIDQKGALAELAEGGAQVGGDESAAFARAGAADGKRAAAGGRVEPADEELRANGAQLFHDRVERIPGGDEVLADAVRSRDEVGEFVLLGERFAQVGVGDQVELDRRLAEAPAQLALAL